MCRESGTSSANAKDTQFSKALRFRGNGGIAWLFCGSGPTDPDYSEMSEIFGPPAASTRLEPNHLACHTEAQNGFAACLSASMLLRSKPIVAEPSTALVSSDAGLPPFRQRDEQIGLTRRFAEALRDRRQVNRVNHPFLHAVPRLLSCESNPIAGRLWSTLAFRNSLHPGAICPDQAFVHIVLFLIQQISPPYKVPTAIVH